MELFKSQKDTQEVDRCRALATCVGYFKVSSLLYAIEN
jgi:hypothetical protein